MTALAPLLTVVPTFHGFYESIHSGKIDDVEASIIQDGDGDPIDSIGDLVWENLNHKAVYEGYAKLYCKNFATLHKIPLRFESLNSPREYNFTTDRIFAHISPATAQRIHDRVPPMTLATEIKARFTSRDGFSSFYSNDLQDPEWQAPLGEWDHNMLGTLISAYLRQENSEESLHEQEWEMVDDCNSAISSLVWSNLPKLIQDEISAKQREAVIEPHFTGETA